MSVSLKVTNLSQFQGVFRNAAALSSRSLHTFTNSELYQIVKEARDRTPIAGRATIETALGADLKSERIDKNGRKRRRYSYSPTPLVYGIINARRKRAGLSPIPKGEMAAAAKKLVVGRLRAIGSLRSGWTRGLAILASNLAESIDRSGPPVKQASTAKPAQAGWSPVAELTYRETVQKDGGGKEIDPRVVAALDGSFEHRRVHLIQRLENKVREDLEKAGAI